MPSPKKATMCKKYLLESGFSVEGKFKKSTRKSSKRRSAKKSSKRRSAKRRSAKKSSKRRSAKKSKNDE